MRLIASNESFTQADWEKLIGSALNLIKPELRHMSLRPIGEVEIGSKSQHMIWQDEPNLNSTCPTIDLNTRAFYSRDGYNQLVADGKYSGEDFPSRAPTNIDYWFWGVSRDGKLLTVYVDCILEGPNRTENAQRVRIYERNTLSEFLEVCERHGALPMFIWSRLCQVLKKHAERRRDSYMDAQQIAGRFELFNESLRKRFRE